MCWFEDRAWCDWHLDWLVNRTNIDGGLLVLVSSCWRAGVLSEPSLDCVMAVLGVRESRNARRLRESLRLKEGKASDWKPDSRPRSHQQFRCFLQRRIETNLPAQFDIHLVLGNHTTISIQRTGSPEAHAGTFSSSLCFLPQPGRALLQAHHPSRPFGIADRVRKCDSLSAPTMQLHALHVNS